MTDLPASTQPPAALRLALVGAIGRRRSRIRFRASVAVATSVAVVAALFGGGVFTGGPERVLAIDDNGGEWVTVQILDGDAGAAEMTQELQDAGIDGEVRVVPSEPGFVGHWMGVTLGPNPHTCDLPENAPDNVICLNPILGGPAVGLDGDVFEIRRDAIDELKTPAVFYVGRTPEAGETAVDPSDLGLINIGNIQR
jgi:hypothetical protein